ncbi:MAG TPA: hypothetical protein VK135_05405 [Candidatus Dormibacteraeota bacterium]|nr:hypothetical protein [Candidatus Dormibacteraeota bacterium]
MTEKNIKTGVVSENELFYFYDYFKRDQEGYQYALLVTNNRGNIFSARMIDEDGEDWYILKLLFENQYKRIKKNSVRSFEIKKFSD